jgi:4-hydroxy-tetrahydrodipicolinate reductase
MTVLNVAIAGASGRMGRMLIEAVLAAPELNLAAAMEQSGNAHVGKEAAESSAVRITDDIEEGLRNADVLIDFTRPEGTMHHLAACQKLKRNFVVGTTGFDDAQLKAIRDAAQMLPIAMAPNFAIGVNVTFKLIELAAKALKNEYEVEIVEVHHRHKVDAPSGTALKMGELVAKALGRDPKKTAVYGREGVTGERKNETIGFSSIRGGDVVGDHTVMFLGAGERIEITHRSASRATYAQGALQAARFLQGKKSGLYDMHDVLGFR